jgi:sterol 3beta-glucosyltransferase
VKVLLVTSGSRGDVQPFVALAHALQEAGHEAVVGAPRRFDALAASVGVAMVGLDDLVFELQDELSGAGVKAALTATRRARPYLQRWLDDLAELVDLEPDLVVFTQKALGGAAIAERCGVPAIPAQLIPLAPATAAFAMPLAPRWTPRALRRLSWRLGGAVEAPWRSMVARWRSERLGLPPQGLRFADLLREHGILSAWSPHLLPAPPDWPAAAAPTGFWTLPAPAEPLSDELERFLTAGDAPVLVGFGSMLSANVQALTEEVVAGLRTAGRRGLLVSGWAGLGRGLVAPDVFVIDQVPYQAVLPRVAAAVHHGGVGTTAAALAAGVPQVVHPFFGDQPFWADRLRTLGLAPDPLDVITADRLADALDDAEDCRANARRFQDALAGENGTATAIARLETVRTTS